MLALALFAALASPVAGTSVDGRWVSPCLAMGKDGRHGTIFRLTVAGHAIEMVGQTYAHADCDMPTIETRLTARLDSLSERDHRIAATVTIDDVTMKPETPDVVAIWNRNPEAKRCAAQEWHLGEIQSVAGGACVAGHRFPDRGAHLDVNASHDGDTLRLPYPLPGGDGSPITFTRDQ